MQHAGADAVELALHQGITQVNNRNFHAVFQKAVGGFQPEEAAADDDGMIFGFGDIEHGVDVMNVAKADDALKLGAGDRQDEGVGTCCQQQAIVRDDGAVGRFHLGAGTVDFGDGHTLVEGDVVFFIPLIGVEHDFTDGLFTSKHRREHDAVVIAVRLGAKDGDVVMFRVDFEELFDSSHAGHAIADDD